MEDLGPGTFVEFVGEPWAAAICGVEPASVHVVALAGERGPWWWRPCEGDSTTELRVADSPLLFCGCLWRPIYKPKREFIEGLLMPAPGECVEEPA